MEEMNKVERFLKNSEIRVMPEKFISNGSYSGACDMFRQLWNPVPEAYNQLVYKFGEDVIPRNPIEITKEKLSAYIEEMVEKVKDSPKSVEVWHDIQSYALKRIRVILKFLEKFPESEFAWNESASWDKNLRVSNKEETLRKAATCEVTEEMLHYYKLMKTYVETEENEQELRDFEAAHNMRKPKDIELRYCVQYPAIYVCKYQEGCFDKFLPYDFNIFNNAGDPEKYYDTLRIGKEGKKCKTL